MYRLVGLRVAARAVGEGIVPGFCGAGHPGVRWGALALGALRLDIGNVLPPRRCWRAVVGCLGRHLRLGQPRRRGQRRRRVYTTSFAGHSATAPTGAPERAISDGSRARAIRRSAPQRSEDLRQRWRPLFTDVVGSLPPAGKSAFVEAVVGKRLPLSLISIPSSHPKGVRQRFERRRAKNTT